jgi:hypothetical protein
LLLYLYQLIAKQEQLNVKIGIIGSGLVGSTAAYALVIVGGLPLEDYCIEQHLMMDEGIHQPFLDRRCLVS